MYYWIMSQKLYGPFFHGGTWDGAKPIKIDRGGLGTGAYFTPDIERAKEYAKYKNGLLIQAYLELNNPLLIEMKSNERGWLEGHPCILALVQLGMKYDKATKKVEKTEEEKGYMGKEISTLAMKQGYDSLMIARDGTLSEVVIWNSNKVFQTQIIS